jgi:aspartate racemase
VRPALTLGVLGLASGPAITFLERLQGFSASADPAEQIHVVADINPRLPDLATPGSTAGALLAEAAGALAGAGADVLAILSDAAHVHLDLIENASGVPAVDMIQAAAQAARDTGAWRVGVLGARPALRPYREYLAAQGLGVIALDAEGQATLAAALAQARSGKDAGAVTAACAGLVSGLLKAGAECVILAEPEFTRLAMEADGAPLIRPIELLAQRCALVCLGLEPAPTSLAR